jgi:hypothetical protein
VANSPQQPTPAAQDSTGFAPLTCTKAKASPTERDSTPAETLDRIVLVDFSAEKSPLANAAIALHPSRASELRPYLCRRKEGDDMAFYVDLSTARIVEVADGTECDVEWRAITAATAAIYSLQHGQELTREQLDAVRDGDMRRFRKLCEQVAAVRSGAAPPPPPGSSTGTNPQSTARDKPSAGYIVASVVALVAWAWAAGSTTVRFRDGQDTIDRAWDISAIQIQQINGGITAYGITAIAVAFAFTVPLLIVRR